MIASSVEINESNAIRSKFEDYACASVFFFSCPKVYNSLKPIKLGFAKPKKGAGRKDNTFAQMFKNICGIYKLKWPRCFRLVKKILNLKDVFKN